MAKRLDRLVYVAINRAMTPSFDRWSKKTYGISGKKLLAKVASAEGGGTTQKPNVSYAGARGPFQFIPSTRNDYKAKYGLDAWRTNTEAAKAAMIHLKGTGIRGYNPGMPSYQNLVLGQDVDTRPLRTGGYGRSRGVKGGQRVAGRPGSVTLSRTSAMPGQADLASLIAGLAQQEQGPPQSMGLQAPSFSAQPVMPAGYQVPQGVAPPPKQNDLAAKLAAVSALQPVQIPRSTVSVDPGTRRLVGGAGTTSGGAGRLRAGGGYKGTEGLIRGLPTFGLRVTSEKRPKKFTSSGNISDHWQGAGSSFARDLGGSKAQMDRAFKQYRKVFGRPLKYNAYNNFQVKTNKGRYQIQVIYGPAVGHHDHIHIGSRRIG